MNHRRWRGFVWLALIVPVAVLAGTPAQDADEPEQVYAWQSAVVEQMESIGTADSLTAAAMLLPVPLSAVDYNDQATMGKDFQATTRQSAAARLRLLDLAATLEPDAADIAALALRLCGQVESCDMAKRVQNLHSAAPDDAGYLIPALIKAHKESNEGQVSEILQTMAEASSLNSYYADVRRRLQTSTNQTSDWPELPAKVKASDLGQTKQFAIISLGSIYMYTVADLPGFGTIDNVCKESNTHFADRHEACRHIALTLSRDNSLISARIGLALWRRTARDDADLAAAKRASHISDWRMETYSQALMDDSIDSSESLQGMLDNGGEIPSVLALLKKYDLPPLPPEGWVSRREKRADQKDKISARDAAMSSGTP